ncbi:MAG TPA: prolyl oligopeptidase family serine peptidase [Methylibium sp.]|nr:prolyl oligopeptidase family serine peptidase [Methylibium sp.]
MAAAADEQAGGATPVEGYFRLPAIEDARLSPGGRYLAMAAESADGKVQLVVTDLDDPPASPKPIAAVDRADVVDLQWLNDEWLVFHERARTSQCFRTRHGRVALWAVQRDGRGQRLVIRRDWGDFRGLLGDHSPLVPARAVRGGASLVRIVGDGSPSILVYVPAEDFDPKHPLARLAPQFYDGRHEPALLLRLNVATGQREVLVTEPVDADSWMVDASGAPRLAQKRLGASERVYWRDPKTDEWTVLLDQLLPGRLLSPFAFERDGMLLVARQDQDHDTQAMYRYDLRARKFEAEPMLTARGFDVPESVEIDNATREIFGAHLATETARSVWFVPELQRLQAGLDAALPGQVNRLVCDPCLKGPRVLLRSWSAQEPSTYWVYTRATQALKLVGHTRPRIDPAKMAGVRFHRVAARDGLPLPVYVTTPTAPAAGPRPTVLLLPDFNGGRRLLTGAWQPEAQWLASRGYLVLQPEVRGSSGYGYKHDAAGGRQYGLGIQDDIADTLAWAAAKGLADSTRVAVAGEGLGGYHALMALVRHPSLYRCGVSLDGIVEPAFLFSDQAGYSEWHRTHSLPRMFGDPAGDAEHLMATSPLLQAARIQAPVLLAQSRRYRTYPMGVRMRDALAAAPRAARASDQWIEYSAESAKFGPRGNDADFWARADTFIARCFAPATDDSAKAPS